MAPLARRRGACAPSALRRGRLAGYVVEWLVAEWNGYGIAGRMRACRSLVRRTCMGGSRIRGDAFPTGAVALTPLG